MRTETRTVRIGEKVGEVDWSYDFRQHFNSMCSPDAEKDRCCEKAKERLRRVEAALKSGETIYAVRSGGICGDKVVEAGMYDGWPYWRPVPSILVRTSLGPDWMCFSTIGDVYTPPRGKA